MGNGAGNWLANGVSGQKLRVLLIAGCAVWGAAYFSQPRFQKCRRKSVLSVITGTI
jgi:hypothetical protein